MTYRRWTDAERYQLRKLRTYGLTRREIGKILGRTWRAVKHQLESWRHD